MYTIANKRVSRIAIHRKLTVQAALRWFAVILWMGAIFAVSAIPSIATPLEPVYDFTFKKLAHVTEYGILTGLLFNAVRIHIRHKRYALLTAALVAVLYACSDEWHQTFVPGREGTLRDAAIDAVGAVGMSIWLGSKSEGFHRREPSAAKPQPKFFRHNSPRAHEGHEEKIFAQRTQSAQRKQRNKFRSLAPLARLARVISENFAPTNLRKPRKL